MATLFNVAKSVFGIVHTTQDSFFEESAKFPWRTERFAKGMSLYNTLKGNNASYLLEGYPWGELGVLHNR